MKKEMKKEIGGFIEFEHYSLPMLHQEAIKVNSARNCLVYLIKTKHIEKVLLPYYLCDSVSQVCIENGVRVKFFSIGKDFKPVNLQPENDEWIYLVNYFGLISDEYIVELKINHKKVIVDNVQAYFRKPVEGVDTIYSCRKYFGVPDGGILYTDVVCDVELNRDKSYDRFRHLMGRYEVSASDFFDGFRREEIKFAGADLQHMSKMTENLLHSFDYEHIRDSRNNNFQMLHENLKEKNRLSFSEFPDGPFMYPFYVENGSELRRQLVANKIYIPTLWPEVLKQCKTDSVEYNYTDNILPLPVDQRYSAEDMMTVVELIRLFRGE